MHPRDYRLLHYFAEVAGCRSLTAAAERLHVSVPVVSQALADLEARLGVTLASRGPRRFELTVAGGAVLAEARGMQHRAALAMRVNAGRDADVETAFTLTLPTELATSWLPDVMARFHRRYPNVAVDIRVGDRVVDLAASGIDLALRATRLADDVAKRDETGTSAAAPLAPSGDSGRTSPVVARESTPVLPLTIVRPATTRRWPLERLVRELPFIGFAARADNARIRFRERRGGPMRELAVRTLCTVDNALLACELVRRGLGMALVMESTARAAIEAGEILPLSRRHDYGAVRVETVFRDALPNVGALLFAETLCGRTEERASAAGAPRPGAETARPPRRG